MRKSELFKLIDKGLSLKSAVQALNNEGKNITFIDFLEAKKRNNPTIINSKWLTTTKSSAPSTKLSSSGTQALAKLRSWKLSTTKKPLKILNPLSALIS